MIFDDAWMEEQYVKDFDNVFHAFKNKRIAIYGIGKNSMRILTYCKSYNLSCVCAKDHWGENFCGYQIISLHDAIKASDLMIIAATTHSTEVVYDRIKSHIPENYPVFNMQGRNMTISCSYQDNIYWQRNLCDLKAAIDTHNVISFDIFDTLLVRRTLYPQDIFDLIQVEYKDAGDARPFAKWRREAESEQITKGYFPNWQEIFHYIKKKHGLSDAEIENWKNREWNLELQSLIPRKDMLEAYNYAKQRGKKVVLCSDMYFSCRDMKTLLSKNGIKDYDKLFVSCDYQATKENGKLYIQVLQFAGKKTILHIGDNEHADDFVPKHMGIDTYPIKSAVEMLNVSSCSSILKQTNNIFDRLLLGDCISYLFNSPFALSESKGKAVLKDLNSFIRLCILPTTMRYMQYIVQLARNEKNSIFLFVSRDGYFLNKVYQKIASSLSLPDSVYFYTSRQAAYSSMIKNQSEFELLVQYILSLDNENLKYQLENVFHCSFPESFDMKVADAIKRYGKDKLMKMINSKSESIIQSEGINRKRYLKYISKLHFEKYDKIFCVDLVTKGTVAYALQSLLKRNVELVALGGARGLSFFVSNDHQHLLFGKSNFFSTLWSYFPVLEMIFASREGQVCGFDEDGNPLFAEHSKYNTELLDEVQKILMESLNENMDKEWINHILSNEFCSQMLGLISKDSTDINYEVSEGFSFTDPLTGGEGNHVNILQYLRNEDK